MAEFADGTRTLDLSVTDSSFDGHRLDITLTDAACPLRVVLYYLVRPEVDVIDRWATLHNAGPYGTSLRAEPSAQPIVVRKTAADIRLPAGATRLTYLPGTWGAEPQPARIPLADGRIELDTRGLTNHRARPWFAVDDGNSGEEQGEVWSASLAWTGPFRLSVERSADNGLHAVLGMHDLDFGYRLDAGASLELPVVALWYSPAVSVR